MGTSINIQVTGFVGSDPQVKTVGEQQVASFSVAVNRKNGGGKKQIGSLQRGRRWLASCRDGFCSVR